MPAEIAGLPVVVSRTGWSGELGYEIFPLSDDRAMELFDTVLEAGAEFGMLVTGPNLPKALEAGISDTAYYTNAGLNALEFGRDGLVDLDAGPFVGREALLEIRKAGVRRRVVGLLGPPGERLPPARDLLADPQWLGAERSDALAGVLAGAEPGRRHRRRAHRGRRGRADDDGQPSAGRDGDDSRGAALRRLFGPGAGVGVTRTITAFPRRVRVVEHTWITLSDGSRLAARIWLPEDAETEPVPAVLEYIPYRKNDGTALRDAPMHHYFAGHGYAAVRVDMRGSGDSDGILEDEYLPRSNWMASRSCAGWPRNPGAPGAWASSASPGADSTASRSPPTPRRSWAP